MVVELDPRLLEILACPSPDHAPLRVGTPDDPNADALTCTSCGRRFPVVDGVPVLLLDEAQPAPGGLANGSATGGASGTTSGTASGPADGRSGEK